MTPSFGHSNISDTTELCHLLTDKCQGCVKFDNTPHFSATLGKHADEQCYTKPNHQYVDVELKLLGTGSGCKFIFSEGSSHVTLCMTRLTISYSMHVH